MTTKITQAVLADVTVGAPGGQPVPFSSKLFEQISVRDFGAKGDGIADDTAAINAAISAVTAGGGDIFFPPGIYLTTGGHVINSTRRVRIVGAGESATSISHSGNNICFWVRAASLLNAQGSGLCDLQIIGPAVGSSASALRVSDGWGLGAQRVQSRGYNQGRFCELYNYSAWTEGAVFCDIMIRDALYGFEANRSGLGADTDSFYGACFNRCHMDLNGGGNRFIQLTDQGASLPKTLYGFDMRRSKVWWGATGGGKRAINVGANCQVLGRADLIADGNGGNTAGTDFNMLQVADGGIADLYGSCDTRQSSLGSALSVLNIVKQATTFAQNNRRPNARWQGARVQLNGSATAGAAALVGWSSGFAPPFSSWRVHVAYSGWSGEGGADYIVSCHGANNYVSVVKLSGLDASGKIIVRPLNGGVSGGGGSNIGMRFEIYLDPSTSAGAVQWSADVEML